MRRVNGNEKKLLAELSSNRFQSIIQKLDKSEDLINLRRKNHSNIVKGRLGVKDTKLSAQHQHEVI